MAKIKPRRTHIREKLVIFIMLLCWGLLGFRLFDLQILSYDKYYDDTNNGITSETTVTASRGKIMDCNGVVLADNETVERVFISPVDMDNDAERKLVSEKLSAILDVDYDVIYAKACKANRKDETIKKNVGKAEADLVRAFIDEYGLDSVHLVAYTTRYYPYGNLLCHVLGFTGADNQGLYGLEYEYDEYLTGVDGKIVTAKNGLGNDMPYEYEQYIDAENGYTLVLTIDYNIQSMLEKYLEECLEESEAGNRVTAIIMDPDTGGILAMATKPDFDCNDPYTLDYKSQALLEACEYEKGSTEYLEYNTTLLMQMWTNKAINDLYEPGSTFKAITCSMAIEEDVVTRDTAFYCPGYHYVEGYGNIHCFKRYGHGPMTLALGLQKSCNPVLMMTAERLGEETFYKYYEAFGYTSLTGIDLPGEAKTLYHTYDNFNNVNLAVYSFGQTFKTTAIQQITALTAVANDGYLLTPHIVRQILDDDGNVIADFETNVKRQVISSDTSAEIMDILEEGVTQKLGAVNAGVSGYKIAAKTGTSEKRDKPDANGEFTLRIGSCVSIAPSDDPAAVVLVIVDEPTESKAEGSLIAAPYNSKIMSELLPYLGYEPDYSGNSMVYKTYTLSDYSGKSVTEATAALKKLGLSVTVKGSGDTVIAQMPKAGETLLLKNGKVILYTEGAQGSETVKVPDVIGKSASEANELILNSGLNICITGITSSESCYAVKQYPEAGTVVPVGSVVTVELRYNDEVED